MYEILMEKIINGYKKRYMYGIFMERKMEYHEDITLPPNDLCFQYNLNENPKKVFTAFGKLIQILLWKYTSLNTYDMFLKKDNGRIWCPLHLNIFLKIKQISVMSRQRYSNKLENRMKSLEVDPLISRNI